MYLIWNRRISALYTLRIMEKQHFISYFYIHIALTISKYINQIFIRNIHHKYSTQNHHKSRIFHTNIFRESMHKTFNWAINIWSEVTELLYIFQLQGCSHKYYKLQGINSQFHEKTWYSAELHCMFWATTCRRTSGWMQQRDATESNKWQQR